MLQSVPLDIAISAGGSIVIGLGAFFGVRYGLNGAQKDISEIKGGVGSLNEGQTKMRVSVGRIEASLVATDERVDRVETRLDRHIEIDT